MPRPKKTEIVPFDGAIDTKAMAYGTTQQLAAISQNVYLDEEGLIVITDEVTPKELLGILEYSRQNDASMNTQNSMRCFLFGRVLNHYMGMEQINSPATAVSNLRSFEGADLTVADKTIIKWAKMDSQIPTKHQYKGLSPTHYYRAIVDVSVPLSTSATIKRKFRTGQYRILREASEEPDARNPRWIEKRIKELKIELGLLNEKKTIPTGVWKDRHIEYSAILLNWQDADFEEHGVTRGDIRDRLSAIETKLEELGSMPDINNGGYNPSPMPDENGSSEEEDDVTDIEAQELPSEEPAAEEEPEAEGDDDFEE